MNSPGSGQNRLTQTDFGSPRRSAAQTQRNPDAFWTTLPTATMPTRTTPVCATLIAPQSALQRIPRGAHPSQGEPPPGAHARNRRPTGHKGNCEWMGGLPPVPHPADAVGGMGSRVRTYSGWPPAAPKAPYYRQVPIYRRGDDADDARNHGDPHRGASESACFQRYGHERDREGLTNNGEGEVIGCHA